MIAWAEYWDNKVSLLANHSKHFFTLTLNKIISDIYFQNNTTASIDRECFSSNRHNTTQHNKPPT
jgi:hypothetical protein